ncbi:MAG: GTPase [Acidobacteriota bacterium]
MPANLTPQYLEAEERYKQAKDNQERMKALKEMLSTIPKHKGTEKLQADIKRRLAKLRDEMEHKKGGPGKRRVSFHVEREGAAQVAIVGPPNVGKSQLLVRLTNASIEVADYPFTTRTFHPGMMPYENIQIQLIDLPPISAEHMENWVPMIIRDADLILLMIDLSRDDFTEQIGSVGKALEAHNIKLVRSPNRIAEDDREGSKETLIVGNKIDLERARENFEELKRLYGADFPILGISASKSIHLEELKRSLFQMLNIVRVYSKPPGKEPDVSKPFIFQKGSTLLDFAGAVHRDFVQNLKFARVWGSGKFEGQRIHRDYLLTDGDIIELHTG